jgi:hypothetical protein
MLHLLDLPHDGRALLSRQIASFAFPPQLSVTLFLSPINLNAVLHLSELSDQLDVTLESSKVVRMAFSWLNSISSHVIK